MSYFSYLFRTFIQEFQDFFAKKAHLLREEYRYQSKVFEIRKGYGSILKNLFYSRIFKTSAPGLGGLLLFVFSLVLGGVFLAGKLGNSISAVGVVEAKATLLKTESPEKRVAEYPVSAREVPKALPVLLKKPEVEQKLIVKQSLPEIPQTTIPPEERYIILVDKKNKTLKLAEFLNDRYQVIERFTVSIGPLMGAKKIEGDLKTPEGRYKIVKIKTDKELHPQYGPFAFVLNYPNSHDLAKGNTGQGIWIHGSGSNTRSPETKGCIELGNADLVRLQNYVSENTPVYIYPEDTVGIGEKRIDLAAIDTLKKHLDTL